MSPNPTVVIAHGFYHTPKPYQALIDAFIAKNIDAYCPQLPTSDLRQLNVGDISNPDFDLEPPAGGYPQGEEDSKALLAVLKPLIEDQNQSVLLLAHSAGGWVATQAAMPELQAKARRAQGLEGGIIGILYYGAFIIPVNESIHSYFQPKDGTVHIPPWLQFHVSSSPDTQPLSANQNRIRNTVVKDWQPWRLRRSTSLRTSNQRLRQSGWGR